MTFEIDNLRLMLCIQSCQREGFTYLAAALIGILRARLGLPLSP